MNRFFIDKTNIVGRLAEIHGDDVSHISKVLRLAVGDLIMLCDGESREYEAAITNISREYVNADIISEKACDSEPPCMVTLFQGVPKAGKLDTIIQKCVELGVHSIVPLQMERSVAKLGTDDKSKNVRFNRISYEAAKQSRRGIIPVIQSCARFRDVDFAAFDLVLAAYEDEKIITLKSAISGVKLNDKKIALIVGPEGGFDKTEIDFINERGAHSVSLGRRILRTETAGMAMLAMLMYEAEG